MPSTEPVDLDLVSEAIEILRELTDEWDHATTTRHDPTRRPIPERIIIDAFPALITSARRGAAAERVIDAARAVAHQSDESPQFTRLLEALEALDASSSATTGGGAHTVHELSQCVLAGCTPGAHHCAAEVPSGE
ncbi:MAG: hypothetical protein JWO62_3354 [Acidimicrobiaceae bacterium]|jgi:hypothetical protein|nr:hypothetical protein [Acidimicrobiaceae bacterium]